MLHVQSADLCPWAQLGDHTLKLLLPSPPLSCYSFGSSVALNGLFKNSLGRANLVSHFKMCEFLIYLESWPARISEGVLGFRSPGVGLKRMKGCFNFSLLAAALLRVHCICHPSSYPGAFACIVPPAWHNHPSSFSLY